MLTLSARLVEIAERIKNATPGPWVVYRPWLSRGSMSVHGVIPRANLHPEEAYQVKTEHNHGSCSYSLEVAVPAMGHSCDDGSDAAKNMELIAHAPADLQFLLDQVAKQNEELKWRREFHGITGVDQLRKDLATEKAANQALLQGPAVHELKEKIAKLEAERDGFRNGQLQCQDLVNKAIDDKLAILAEAKLLKEFVENAPCDCEDAKVTCYRCELLLRADDLKEGA